MNTKIQSYTLHLIKLSLAMQARNQTFLEGGSKSGMVAQMKWAL